MIRDLLKKVTSRTLKSVVSTIRVVKRIIDTILLIIVTHFALINIYITGIKVEDAATRYARMFLNMGGARDVCYSVKGYHVFVSIIFSIAAIMTIIATVLWAALVIIVYAVYAALVVIAPSGSINISGIRDEYKVLYSMISDLNTFFEKYVESLYAAILLEESWLDKFKNGRKNKNEL